MTRLNDMELCVSYICKAQAILIHYGMDYKPLQRIQGMVNEHMLKIINED